MIKVPFNIATELKVNNTCGFYIRKVKPVGIGKMETKRPKVANQGIKVMVGKGRLQIRRLWISHWIHVLTVVHICTNMSKVQNKNAP
jgi:hypothetical protein